MKEYRVHLGGDREGVMTYFSADNAKALRKMIAREYPSFVIARIEYLRAA